MRNVLHFLIALTLHYIDSKQMMLRAVAFRKKPISFTLDLPESFALPGRDENIRRSVWARIKAIDVSNINNVCLTKSSTLTSFRSPRK